MAPFSTALRTCELIWLRQASHCWHPRPHRQQRLRLQSAVGGRAQHRDCASPLPPNEAAEACHQAVAAWDRCE